MTLQASSTECGPEADGEASLVWQSPPTGGWGVPRLALERPPYDHAVVTPGRSSRPACSSSRSTEPRPDHGGRRSADQRLRSNGERLRAAERPRRRAATAAPRRRARTRGRRAGRRAPRRRPGLWSSAEVRTLRYVGSPYLPEGAALGVVEVNANLAARDAGAIRHAAPRRLRRRATAARRPLEERAREDKKRALETADASTISRAGGRSR